MASPSPIYWRLSPSIVFQLKCWDEEECVLFNISSGQTHLLNEFGAIALRLLEAKPLSYLELSRRLMEECDGLVLDSDLENYINNMLLNLDGLGLIEPYSS